MTTIPNSEMQTNLAGWKAKAARMETERDTAREEAAERTAERDRARDMVAALEAQLAAAQDALITEARRFFLHAQQRTGPQLDAGARYAYGQANGAEQTLAAFLTVVAYDDQAEYPDPIDCARLYAEGRDPLREAS